ncbi:MAG: hypothetical protein H6R17_3971 [Proteobacteria bacterium]|nr:hypothetical protein [Pseudomonadota bacterium]
MYISKVSKNLIPVCVLASVFSGLSGCGGGGDDGNSASATAATPAIVGDTTTLASCMSPSLGKQYAAKEAGSEITVSFYGGTYNGSDVTVEKHHRAADPSGVFSELYTVYTPEKLTNLGDRDYNASGTIDTTTYAGYSIDLTKKVGESQVLSITKTNSYGPSTYSSTFVFDGVETLTMAGVTLNTCRTMLVGENSLRQSRPGTSTTTAWFAAGYGFSYPVKVSASFDYSDGKAPARESFDNVVILTVPLH